MRAVVSRDERKEKGEGENESYPTGSSSSGFRLGREVREERSAEARVLRPAGASCAEADHPLNVGWLVQNDGP